MDAKPTEKEWSQWPDISEPDSARYHGHLKIAPDQSGDTAGYRTTIPYRREDNAELRNCLPRRAN